MKRIGFRIRLGLASVEENDQEKKEDQEDQDGLGFGSKSDSEWESNQIRSQDLDKRQVSSTPRFHPLLPHRRELGEPGYNTVYNARVCALCEGLLLLLLLLQPEAPGKLCRRQREGEEAGEPDLISGPELIDFFHFSRTNFSFRHF